MEQRGIIALSVPLLLIVIGAVLVVILISTGIIKNPLPKQIQQLIPAKEPTVSLQKQYQNPFDKGAQYVNPFTKYKNPFDALKQAK